MRTAQHFESLESRLTMSVETSYLDFVAGPLGSNPEPVAVHDNEMYFIGESETVRRNLVITDANFTNVRSLNLSNTVDELPIIVDSGLIFAMNDGTTSKLAWGSLSLENLGTFKSVEGVDGHAVFKQLISEVTVPSDHEDIEWAIERTYRYSTESGLVALFTEESDLLKCCGESERVYDSKVLGITSDSLVISYRGMVGNLVVEVSDGITKSIAIPERSSWSRNDAFFPVGSTGYFAMSVWNSDTGTSSSWIVGMDGVPISELGSKLSQFTSTNPLRSRNGQVIWSHNRETGEVWRFAETAQLVATLPVTARLDTKLILAFNDFVIAAAGTEETGIEPWMISNDDGAKAIGDWSLSFRSTDIRAVELIAGEFAIRIVRDGDKQSSYYEINPANAKWLPISRDFARSVDFIPLFATDVPGQFYDVPKTKGTAAFGREVGVRRYCAGDANYDGLFNTTDLLQLFQLGEYEDDIVGNSTWLSGDFNGDGEFDSADIVLALQSGRYDPG